MNVKAKGYLIVVSDDTWWDSAYFSEFHNDVWLSIGEYTYDDEAKHVASWADQNGLTFKLINISTDVEIDAE